jgi:hypothetical protein
MQADPAAKEEGIMKKSPAMGPLAKWMLLSSAVFLLDSRGSPPDCSTSLLACP